MFDRSIWAPPEQISVREWAERYYHLSGESSAQTGRFRPYPYQRGILDALGDPEYWRVTLMKSARVGSTKILNVLAAHTIDVRKQSMMVVQPTVEDAEGYSKEEIAPMFRDCPRLRSLGGGDRKSKSDTILHKKFPGRVLSFVGANSGRGLRRVARAVGGADEVDAFPISAGADGDVIALLIRRMQTFRNRKLFCASTPLVEGQSRIKEMFLEGDQRYYLVPCPMCGHFARFVPEGASQDDGNHFMVIPPENPGGAHFVCGSCAREIGHDHKVDMLEDGKWTATAVSEDPGHASFHIWAAYSMSPNVTWGDIGKEKAEARRSGDEVLRTHINTVEGNTWVARGDSPDHEAIMARREDYPLGSIPVGVDLITCGVDVQKDRIYYEIVGWSQATKESWGLEYDCIYTDPYALNGFAALDALLERSFGGRSINMLAIDAGFATQEVYNWARKYPMSRVMAVMGFDKQSVILRSPRQTDLKMNGKSVKPKASQMWPVGVSLLKGELYGRLRLQPGQDGYCHFSAWHDRDFLEQLTSEQFVETLDKKGKKVRAWVKKIGRQNHYLDCRNYARAAAARYKFDMAYVEPTTQTIQQNADISAPREDDYWARFR